MIALCEVKRQARRGSTGQSQRTSLRTGGSPAGKLGGWGAQGRRWGWGWALVELSVCRASVWNENGPRSCSVLS